MTIVVKILVATMTGTAELVAEEAQEVLEAKGIRAEVELMDGLECDVFDDSERVYLIASSTYGQGDVPDNGQKLSQSLANTNPDLSAITYGIIALGDRTYVQTFCNGGLTFDRQLSALGAKRVGEVYKHDASSGTLPEDEIIPWAEGWADDLVEALKQAA